MFNLSTLWKLRADNPVKAGDDPSKKPVVMSLVGEARLRAGRCRPAADCAPARTAPAMN
jgi:hypothetical protein